MTTTAKGLPTATVSLVLSTACLEVTLPGSMVRNSLSQDGNFLLARGRSRAMTLLWESPIVIPGQTDYLFFFFNCIWFQLLSVLMQITESDLSEF